MSELGILETLQSRLCRMKAEADVNLSDCRSGARLGVRDLFADALAALESEIEDARDRDPEIIAEREDEDRHVNGLRNWAYGRV